MPLLLLFSGQVFTGTAGAIAVQPVPWHKEATVRMPVAVWREAMDAHFPGQAWLRVSRPTYDRLSVYRGRHGLVSWDASARAAHGGGGRVTPMEAARAVADAVLYEGYVLYPYRASSAKNQVRWQWGVLMPPDVAGPRPLRAVVEPHRPRRGRQRRRACGPRCASSRCSAGTSRTPPADAWNGSTSATRATCRGTRRASRRSCSTSPSTVTSTPASTSPAAPRPRTSTAAAWCGSGSR